MVKIFSLGKRIFRLDINSWREMRRKGRYLRYYVRPVKDDRNSLARNVDFYGPLLVALLATLAASALYAGSPLKALGLAAPIMALESLAAFRLRKVFRDKAAVHDIIWRAGMICQDRIKKIKDIKKLEELVVEILEKTECYTDVHAVKESAAEGDAGKEGIALRAACRGVPLAVGCMLPGGDESAVEAERVVRFREEMRRLDIRRGVIVASGAFSVEARRAATEGKSKITLVDIYGLVDLARQAGHGIFPAVPGEAPAGAGSSHVRRRKLFRFALAREKTRGYLFSAGVLLALYCLNGATPVLSPLYLGMGLVNLGLSAYCVLSNRESQLPGTGGQRA